MAIEDYEDGVLYKAIVDGTEPSEQLGKEPKTILHPIQEKTGLEAYALTDFNDTVAIFTSTTKIKRDRRETRTITTLIGDALQITGIEAKYTSLRKLPARRAR